MVMVRLVISLFMSLKKGTSKNSEKVPYYFLCQQQNICILNCTDISLQILGCACSFSVLHGMLHIWAAEMPHSCIPELLPGHWPQCRGPPLPLFSLLSFSCVYTDIYVFFPIGFSCFVCFFSFFCLFSFVSNANVYGYILKVLLRGLRSWLCVAGAWHVPQRWCGCSTRPLPCSPWGHWEALSIDAHCTIQKFPCGQIGCVWYNAV